MTVPIIIARLKRIAQERCSNEGWGNIHPIGNEHSAMDWFSSLEFQKFGDHWEFVLWINDDSGSTHIVHATMEQLENIFPDSE